MATSQTPGGDQNQQQASVNQATVQNLIEANRLQGDYGNILRSNITSLQKQLKEFDKINAKIETLEKTSINIKDINREILKNSQKQFLSNQKVSDLEKQFSKAQKKGADDYLKAINKVDALEAKLAKAKTASSKARYEQEIAAQQRIIDNANETFNVDQLAYVAAKKENEINDKIAGRLKEQLKIEKEIGKQIGLTGAVFKNFADKLGIGDRYYEQMVAKARQLNDQGKKFTFTDKLAVLANAAKGAAGEVLNDPIALVGALSKAVPFIGSMISGLVSGIKSVFEFIAGVQDKTVKFGRALGISTQEAGKIRERFADINIASGDLLVNTEKLMASQTELAGLLGTENILTNEQLATNIRLNEVLGLDAETRASIAQSSVITGKASEDITKSVIAQVVGLKQATGISLDYRKVLGEASKLGGYLGLQFAQFPGKIAKALVVTKSFGLELKQLDGLASSFLDFESSISKEFEAQVLLNKNLNLTKARQAFLDNDLATAASEITKNVGDALEYNKLNRIQQEALAAAVGMSRDQLGDMLKNQLYLEKLGAKETSSATEKLKLARERFKTEKEINKQLGEGAYQNLVTMSATEKIAAFVEKVRVAIGDFLQKSGIVDKLTNLMDKLSNPETVRKAMMMIRDFAAALVHMVGVLVKGITRIPFLFSDEERQRVANFFDEAESRIGLMGGGMEPTTGLNTGGVMKERVASTSPYIAAAQQANTGKPIVYDPTFVVNIGNEKIVGPLRMAQQQDQGNTKK